VVVSGLILLFSYCNRQTTEQAGTGVFKEILFLRMELHFFGNSFIDNEAAFQRTVYLLIELSFKEHFFC
jgi:hypothetical protein